MLIKIIFIAFTCSAIRGFTANAKQHLSRNYTLTEDYDFTPVKQKPPTNSFAVMTDVSAKLMAKVRNNDEKTIFALSMPGEEMKETGDRYVDQDRNMTLRRLQHYVHDFPIWNSGGMLLETKMPGTELPMVSLTLNDVNSQQAFSQVAERVAPSRAGIRRVCIEALNSSMPRTRKGGIAKGKIRSGGMQMYMYVGNNGISSSGDSVCTVAEVALHGVHRRKQFLYYCLVNITSTPHKVILTWNGIQNATQFPGGNVKIGYQQRPVAGLLISKTNETSCRYKNSERNITVYDHRNPSASFDCSQGPRDAVNGGYGPMTDAYFHALKTLEMFRTYLGLSTITTSGMLSIFAHSKYDRDNAYYHSQKKAIYLGDGRYYFHPLGTCIDIVAHEIAHALTDSTSRLLNWKNESACLSESIADVVGEVAEFYVTGANDFLIASNCTKPGTPFLRNMSEPAFYSDYFPQCQDPATDCQDAHDCSKIGNYIFYTLATQPGWSVVKAGRAFILANVFRWQRTTTYFQAGCGVADIVETVQIAKGDTAAVVKAWKTAGIDISSCVNVQEIQNCKKKEGLRANKGEMLHFTVTSIPKNVTLFWIQTYANNGDADLYFSYSQPPSLAMHDKFGFYIGSIEYIHDFNATRIADKAYVMINANEAFENLFLYACFL